MEWKRQYSRYEFLVHFCLTAYYFYCYLQDILILNESILVRSYFSYWYFIYLLQLERYHSECLSHNCIMINNKKTSSNMITLLLGDLSVKWSCSIWFVLNKRGFCVVAVQSECFCIEWTPCFHKISLGPLQFNIHHTWYDYAIINAQSIFETFFRWNRVTWFFNLKTIN